MVMGPVHVIGGGFSGAAAAVHLADRGVPVTLWETRASPGGRVADFAGPDGERLDNGPHLFLGGYRHTRALLQRLGTVDRLAFQDHLHLPISDRGARSDLICPPVPAPWFLLCGLWGMAGLSLADRFGMLRAGLWLRGSSRAQGSVTSWLRQVNAPDATVRLLWDPLCRAVVNLAPDEADASVFVAALREALMGTAADACLGWATSPLGGLLGDGLPPYLNDRGGSIRRGQARAVRLDALGAVAGIVAADGVEVATDHVVVATGPASAARLVPVTSATEPLHQTLAAMRWAPIVSTYLWLDRAVMPTHGPPMLGCMGGRAEWVFDRARLHGPVGTAPGHCIVAVTSAADDLLDASPEQIQARMMADLTPHLPLIADARVQRVRVVKERRATVRLTPGLSRPEPGPVDGMPGLYLCGDYTDTGLPATIEGAVRSGERVAARLLAAAG